MVTTCSICGTTEAVDPGEFIKSNLRNIMEERGDVAFIVLFGLIIWVYIKMTQNGWLLMELLGWYILTYPLLREDIVSSDVGEEK